MIDKGELWLLMILLGLGSFTLRFAFLGLIGDRPLPPWILRHLRYTAVAVLPGLVAPLVVWPEATGGVPDAPRMAAALVTIIAGIVTRNMLLAIFLGASTLYGGLYLLG
ncbi:MULTISPECIES: AzlD domain-containing protein [Roseovarius]|uniref:AzlD domain-containing protein n=1 Tax=Roseovarius TaxID=74030 RepID=UPI001C0CDA87|nr:MULTISPECIES: AzlD domain-containing protein [Roseovarius]MBU3261031.1 AzlD domain-containing protein [Roseovarius sp. PS-C2]MDW3117712.1 AzlD domain-containing protein [Roseovarius pacificus]